MTQYTNIEEVHLRTLAGRVPKLPATVWALPQNGPLAYVAVSWPAVDPDSLASTGTVKVAGTLTDAGQKVTATIHVVKSLHGAIGSLDYAATVTPRGTAPVCPRTVIARYTDGSVSSTVPVRWKRPHKHEYARADELGDIPGTVAGFRRGATCTFFVIDPAETTDAPPHVELTISGSPNDAGWYTKAPTLTIEATKRAAPIRTVEYSFDEGRTWTAYRRESVTVTAQGDITVVARAVDGEGRTGQAKASLQVDTSTPTTTVAQEQDGSAVRFTLTATDAPGGSGVNRIVYSSGPDEDPGSSRNDMWATYTRPFTITRRSTPMYVHVRAQDAAGNQEKAQTVTLKAV